MLVIDIHLGLAGSYFKLLLQVFSRHAIMYIVKSEREILRYHNFFSFQIFVLSIRKRYQGFFFFINKQIIS